MAIEFSAIANSKAYEPAFFEKEDRTFVPMSEAVGQRVEIDDYIVVDSKKYGKEAAFIGFNTDKYTFTTSQTLIERLKAPIITEAIANAGLTCTFIKRKSYKNPAMSVTDIA